MECSFGESKLRELEAWIVEPDAVNRGKGELVQSYFLKVPDVANI